MNERDDLADDQVTPFHPPRRYASVDHSARPVDPAVRVMLLDACSRLLSMLDTCDPDNQCRSTWQAVRLVMLKAIIEAEETQSKGL